MHVGANWPYDMWDENERLSAITALQDMKATEVTIPSHQCTIMVLSLLKMSGIEVIHIRVKTGPQHRGTYPSHIVDYHEWDGETTPREAISNCLELGIIPHVIFGNEPDIEMAELPDNSDWWVYEAEEYKKWYETEVVNLRAAFPDVYIPCSPAPLSQGWHDRFVVWFNTLYTTYRSSYTDFIADHAYLGEPIGEWHERPFTYYGQFNKEIHLTEVNDNGQGRSSDTYRRLADMYSGRGIRAVSFFTLRGGPNSGTAPSWWFLTDDEIAEIGKRDSQEEEVINIMNIYDGFLQLWHAENSDVNPYVGDDFSGIFKAWSRNPREYGSPVGNEFGTSDGRTVQVFATGVYEWKNGGLVKVESEL